MEKSDTGAEFAYFGDGPDDGELNVVDLSEHRTSFEARFPKVDDILDRLTADTLDVARIVGATG